MRPYEKPSPLDSTDIGIVEGAEFTLADGTHMTGFLTPSSDGIDVIEVDPVIVTLQGQVDFLYAPWVETAERTEQNYARLQKTPSQTFPINFKSVVTYEGNYIEGNIEGFPE